MCVRVRCRYVWDSALCMSFTPRTHACFTYYQERETKNLVHRQTPRVRYSVSLFAAILAASLANGPMDKAVQAVVEHL